MSRKRGAVLAVASFRIISNGDLGLFLNALSTKASRVRLPGKAIELMASPSPPPSNAPAVAPSGPNIDPPIAAPPPVVPRRIAVLPILPRMVFVPVPETFLSPLKI